MMTRHMFSWMGLVLVGSLQAAMAAELSESPRAGRPAILVPGGVFGVGERAGDTVTLERGSERFALPVLSSEAVLPVGQGHVRVPENLAPGRYDLLSTKDGETQSQSGVVHVLAEFPTDYEVAVLRGDRGGDSTGSVFEDALVAEVERSAAAIVFLVGALTTDGAPASYAALDAQWAGVSKPVFYCPDEEEEARCHAAGMTIATDHAFAFGEDGYLILGGGISHADVGGDGHMGAIHRWRRALRPSRWSVGVVGRFGLDWSIRSQLILFVDDPLDYLLTGEVSTGVNETLPWGRTRYAIPPSVPTLPLQLITVDSGAMDVVMTPEVVEVPEVPEVPAAE